MDALHLACIILTEVNAEVAELKSWAAEGGIPADVASFVDLQSHCDANMLGTGGYFPTFQPHDVIGKGVADLDEAWCGVFNCAHTAVDAAIKAGLILDAAPIPSAP